MKNIVIIALSILSAVSLALHIIPILFSPKLLPPPLPIEVPVVPVDEQGFMRIEGTNWFLQSDVWGGRRDYNVMLVTQSVIQCFFDIYTREYMLRQNIELRIMPSTSAGGLADGDRIYVPVPHHDYKRFVSVTAHEIFHFMVGRTQAGFRHQWFDEMLAELHSLYVLDFLAEKWKTDPPFEEWVIFSMHFRNEFKAKVHLNDAGLSSQELARLFKENRELLEENPIIEWDFDTNEIRGDFNLNRFVNTPVYLLYTEIFKDSADSWKALAVLGDMGYRCDLTFEEYLSEWYSRCSPDLKPVVRNIAGFFEVQLII
jgi:hypothetical protein